MSHARGAVHTALLFLLYKRGEALPGRVVEDLPLEKTTARLDTVETRLVLC